MEQLTEEKRKELDEKIAKGGDANIKYAKHPQRPLDPRRARRQLPNGLADFVCGAAHP